MAALDGTQRQILVTRPASQAAAWVQKLQALGCGARALPLISIAPAPDADAVRRAWHELAGFSGVMFVSANAVEGFFALRPEGLRWPADVWAASTGPGTSAALRAGGLSTEQIVQPAAASPQFDSEALWLQLQARCSGWQGQRVLLVRGGKGRDWLADTLAQSGAVVQFVMAYQRCPPQPDAAGAALLAASQLWPEQFIWHFSSSEAIVHLQQLLPRANWSRGQAWVTHPRIEYAAGHAGFGNVLQLRPGVDAAAQQFLQLSGGVCAEGAPYNPASCE